MPEMPFQVRFWFLIPVSLFMAIVILLAFYLGQLKGGKSIDALPSALMNQPVPEFSLPSIDGKGLGFTNTALKGQISLVNIWASWCPPCRAEHPLLMRLAHKGINIYGINFKDKPSAASAFLKKLGNPYKQNGADRRGRVSIDWGVYGYPETFIVDTNSHIRYRHVGPILEQDLEQIILPTIKALNP